MKFFLIHDAATEIAAAAFRLSEGSHGLGSLILERAGYGREPTTHDSYVVLIRLHDNFEAQRDAFEWGNATMRTAHLYLLDHFDEVTHGGTIEVQELREAMYPAAPSPKELYDSDPDGGASPIRAGRP